MLPSAPIRQLTFILVFYFCTFCVSGCDSSESVSSTSSPTGSQEEQAGEQMEYTPIEGCLGSMDIEDLSMIQKADNEQDCVLCVGAQMPNFVLQDLNPSSCGIGKHYGLEAFHGAVTFVVLLRSTCGYCHAQLEKLEQLRFELLAMNFELNMVVINEIGTEQTIDYLTQRSQIPVFQDHDSVQAWQALSDPDTDDMNLRVGGDKDDMYIYDANGQLWRFLDDDDDTHQLNLSTDEGYAYLKDTLIEALSE